MEIDIGKLLREGDSRRANDDEVDLVIRDLSRSSAWNTSKCASITFMGLAMGAPNRSEMPGVLLNMHTNLKRGVTIFTQTNETFRRHFVTRLVRGRYGYDTTMSSLSSDAYQ